MSSIEALPVSVAPWTGYEGEVLMPIRITLRAKGLDARQLPEGNKLIATLAKLPKAFYRGTNEEARLLYGSI